MASGVRKEVSAQLRPQSATQQSPPLLSDDFGRRTVFARLSRNPEFPGGQNKRGKHLSNRIAGDLGMTESVVMDQRQEKIHCLIGNPLGFFIQVVCFEQRGDGESERRLLRLR